MNHLHSFVLAITLLVGSVSVATAQDSRQDLRKGAVAYGAGDFATAFRLHMPLAEAGDAEAQYFIGSYYKQGEGVPQDNAEAVKWFRLSSSQGDYISQFTLGVMYERGIGVLQDNVISHMWYNIGAANGSLMSADSRAEITKKMTPAAIEAAQAMARECMSSNYENCGE
tara:strand:- start:539 stop:1045 length:507 start_codon:yes stop_codon:yes gene_type:complete